MEQHLVVESILVMEQHLVVERHLTEKALAHRLCLSVRTLQRWRWRRQRKGPAYLKLGGRVVYRLSDVEAWEARSRIATSEAASTQGDRQ